MNIPKKISLAQGSLETASPGHDRRMSWRSQAPALVADFKRFLKKRGKSREDAEDLIQEAFLRLEQYCRKGNEVECAEAFLRRTVMNLSVSEYRHDSRFPHTRIDQSDIELFDPQPTPDEVLGRRQTSRAHAVTRRRLRPNGSRRMASRSG